MLDSAGWKRFEEELGWQEVIATVKARMMLVQQDTLCEETCDTIEILKALQSEYRTCLWFINLPKVSRLEGEMSDDKD